MRLRVLALWTLSLGAAFAAGPGYKDFYVGGDRIGYAYAGSDLVYRRMVASCVCGGDIVYTNGGYAVHIFLQSGTLTVSGTAVVFTGRRVGGGGAGGNCGPKGGGAGGGGGGEVSAVSYTAEPGQYQVVVGAGGTASDSLAVTAYGGNGGDTSVFGVTAIGGGGGSNGAGGGPATAGRDGASGGGGGYADSGPGAGGAGLAGYAGAQGMSTGPYGGGGGGGGAGGSASAQYGGVGVAWTDIGPEHWFGGGGGAGVQNAADAEGGHGGGGHGGYGTSPHGQPGIPGSGGGGGGASWQVSGALEGWGGNGGSGVVILVHAVTPSPNDFLDGLVVRMPFDDSGTTTNLVNSVFGSSIGYASLPVSSQAVPGKVGTGAMNFLPESGRFGIELRNMGPVLPYGGAPRSVTCWLRWMATPDSFGYLWNYGVNDMYSVYAMRLQDGPQTVVNVTYYAYFLDINVSDVLVDDSWHHIAVTYGNGSARFYRDGGLIATADDWGSVNTQVGDGILCLADILFDGTAHPFGGYMDDFRIYNVALSQNEVQRIVVAGGGILAADVVEGGASSVSTGLTPVWFVAGAGTVDPVTAEYLTGSLFGVLPEAVPSDPGYRFDYWIDEAGTIYGWDSTVPALPTTFYAVYAPL